MRGWYGAEEGAEGPAAAPPGAGGEEGRRRGEEEIGVYTVCIWEV